MSNDSSHDKKYRKPEEQMVSKIKITKDDVLDTLDYWRKMFRSTGEEIDWNKKDEAVYKYLRQLAKRSKRCPGY